MNQLFGKIEDEQAIGVQLHKKIKELQVMCEYMFGFRGEKCL